MSRSSSRKEQNTSHPRLEHLFQFGGSLLKKGHAKTARPLSTAQAMHLVISSSQAKGPSSFKQTRYVLVIERILRRLAKRYRIHIHEYVNGGDHLQMVLSLKRKKDYSPFVRALTGSIAMLVTGASKIKALKKRFWDFRPWTRIITIRSRATLRKDLWVQYHLISLKMCTGIPGYFRKTPKPAPS